MFQEVRRELTVLEIDAEQVAFVRNLGNPLPLERRTELMGIVQAKLAMENRLFAAFDSLKEQLRVELDSKGDAPPIEVA